MLAELATALRGLGKHAEAQRCCTAAVTARPDYQRGWLELGRAQAAQGQCLTLDTTIDHLQTHVARHAGRNLRMEHCCPSSLCDQDMQDGCSHMHDSVRYSPIGNSCITITIVVLYQPTCVCMHSFASSQNFGVLMTGCGQCMHLSLCVTTLTAPIMACMSCSQQLRVGPSHLLRSEALVDLQWYTVLVWSAGAHGHAFVSTAGINRV